MTESTLDVRTRLADDGSFEAVSRSMKWQPNKIAVIICDMWNDHHCVSAGRRVVELAPRMNEVVAAMREKGSLIIHSPSDCMAFYKDTPQRRRAEAAPHADAAVEFKWNKWDLDHESPLPAYISEPGPCACHVEEPCCETGYYPWHRQIDTLEIADGDAISEYGQEVYNLLQQRDIEDVVVMGVHTNVCVMSRPFGLRQMVYLGKRPLLCRDMTDPLHQDPAGHFPGADIIIEHIERHWCPTVTSDQLVTVGKEFRFAEDER